MRLARWLWNRVLPRACFPSGTLTRPWRDDDPLATPLGEIAGTGGWAESDVDKARCWQEYQRTQRRDEP